MWSGPRNISTAMMRSWGARSDTFVCDEPLYAHYLRETQLDHPGRDEVLAAHEQDWRVVAQWLLGPIPQGKSIFYQKHMAHHLLPEVGREWLSSLSHCFLIRDPLEMLTSLMQVTPRPELSDTGLPQQWELFERVRRTTGSPPPVLDSKDILENPHGMLTRLCESLGVPFRESMLSWKPGPRDTDGVWAKHWYSTVAQSSGFKPFVPKDLSLPEPLKEVHRQCVEYYQKLHSHRLLNA
ncbi:MAG: HAD family hydrolase [Deltaproteobacteria bacterium]|nr:HAD family hydrolase [Deltaproteobacteria bacterium]